MSTKYPEVFGALAAPFERHEIKQKPGKGGRQLDYITARAVMNRLDTVLGPEAWTADFEPFAHGTKCRLTITLPDGMVVTKYGVGGVTEMPDSSDTDKTGESDSLKRAAVYLGIGRWLYKDGVPDYGGDDDRPSQARPAPTDGRDRPVHVPPPQNANGNGHGGNGQNYGTPRSGKGLFAWVKEQEQKHEVGLLAYLNRWAKLQDFPARMIDWDADQIGLAHAEASRRLASVGDEDREPGDDR